jgi:hypothetical protein
MNSFEDIRPYKDSEVPGVIERLVQDEEFIRFIGRWRLPLVHRFFPWIVHRLVSRYLQRELGNVTSIVTFQQVVEKNVSRILNNSTTRFHYEGFENLGKDKAYLYVSNHRDIAGDSMLLDYALFHSGFDTVRIAVGDNLIQREFATDLMKLNKSFFIKRAINSKREQYAALMQSSEFILSSLQEGNSIWIAQSEGRAKDGVDKTDTAVIKMLTLSNRKENGRKRDFAESISDFNIVPMSLAYEFDPCDAVKARELASIAATGEYKKSEGEDLLSLVEGLGGFKGNVVLRLGTVLEGTFDSPEEVAAEIDRQIISNFELFPINYWALSKINEPPYSEIWKSIKENVPVFDAKSFEKRLEECEAGARSQWLRMYANPVLSHHKNQL